MRKVHPCEPVKIESGVRNKKGTPGLRLTFGNGRSTIITPWHLQTRSRIALKVFRDTQLYWGLDRLRDYLVALTDNRRNMEMDQ